MIMKKLILLFILLVSNNLFSQAVVFPDLWFAFGDNLYENSKITWFHSNGKQANYGDTWFHSNGEQANYGDTWFHSNGKQANYGDTWYHSNGTRANY